MNKSIDTISFTTKREKMNERIDTYIERAMYTCLAIGLSLFAYNIYQAW